MKLTSDEFYVGYMGQAPRYLARFVKRIVTALGVVVVGAGLLLVFAQQPFPKSTFEFGVSRTYRGLLAEQPYPTLRASSGDYLLVFPGKHGASSFARAYAGSVVEFQGSRIERDGHFMLEILPDSAHLIAQADANYAPAMASLVEVTLVGEIVDSKCFLGVMNPGNGKVHRDCAARCISGGIPPAFIAKDRNGASMFLLLAGSHGEPLSREVLDFVAEPTHWYFAPIPRSFVE